MIHIKYLFFMFMALGAHYPTVAWAFISAFVLRKIGWILAFAVVADMTCISYFIFLQFMIDTMELRRTLMTLLFLHFNFMCLEKVNSMYEFKFFACATLFLTTTTKTSQNKFC